MPPPGHGTWNWSWKWSGDEKEAAEDADADTGPRTALMRSDPRRKPAYRELMTIIATRSYLIIDSVASGKWELTGPFAPPNQRTPEAERLNQLMEFCLFCSNRLQSHFWKRIGKMFSEVPGPYSDYTHDYYTLYPQEDIEDILAEWGDLYEERCCAYQVLHHLVGLRIATDELYQDCSPRRWHTNGKTVEYYDYSYIYWYRDDFRIIPNGDVVINVTGGSSLSHAYWDYAIHPFTESLDGVPIGSAEHKENALAPPQGLESVRAMFGDTLCNKMFDPFGRVREAWPRMSVLMDAIDRGEIDSAQVFLH